MLTVGLTGGIATGKSTVAGLFEKLGAYRIDTDRLARIVVEPGQPAWEAITQFFGKNILDSSGRLDRKKLGEIVFANPEKLDALNKMTHPPVRALLRKQLLQARAQGACVALVEVPLLYEAGFEKEVDYVIVVTTSDETQLSRLIEREKISEREARLRIAAQMPLAEKAALADFCINNNNSVELTNKQVAEIWQRLRQECEH
jgi:dephospho-CoA kinase